MGYYSSREFQKVKERREKAEEEEQRRASVATCECGASCRKDNGEWIHIGPCKVK